MYSPTTPAFPLLMLNFTSRRWVCAVFPCQHDYGTDHKAATDSYLAHVRAHHPQFLAEGGEAK